MNTTEVKKTPKVEHLRINRHMGIGGSDATRIMRGDWHTLWLEKTEKQKPEDLSRVLPVQLGLYTEPVNKQWLEYELNKKVTDYPELYTKKDFMFAHYDGWIEEDNILVECKHTNSNNTLDNVISTYMPQVQHYLMVSETPYIYLSVIFGNNRFEYCKIDEDETYQKKLYEIEKSFWSYVKDNKPPEQLDQLTDQLPKLAGRIKINDMITIDFDETRDNEFMSLAKEWHETKQPAIQHKAIGQVLKAKVPDNCRKATGSGILISRNKAGTLSIKETKGGKHNG
jgi:predicted phage-related endonuclease|tara:strand:+ start:36 stop:884 length:849 start_codon:yes stop_codon:yes gene_type:complete